MPKPHDALASWTSPSSTTPEASSPCCFLPLWSSNSTSPPSGRIRLLHRPGPRRRATPTCSIPSSSAGLPALIYVLFEHQSTVDALMPLRLLKYMVLIWDKYCNNHPNTKRLPPIIPVVLHHSASGWTKSTCFHDLIEPPLADLPELGRVVPNFHVLLDDISRQSNEALLCRPQPATVLAVLWALRDARDDPGACCEDFDAFRTVLVGMSAEPAGSQAMVPWMRYILDVVGDPLADQLKRRVIETVGEVAEKAMATIAEQLGKRAGKKVGKKAGKKAGVDCCSGSSGFGSERSRTAWSLASRPASSRAA